MDFSFAVPVGNTIRAWWKWLLSLFKRDWKLSEYPISVREHEIDPSYLGTRLKQHRYTAQIVNWWVISGGGDTKNEALQELQKCFATAKAEVVAGHACTLRRAQLLAQDLCQVTHDRLALHAITLVAPVAAEASQAVG